MMKEFQIIILLLLFSICVLGQRITYNSILDTSDVETQEVMILFENYIGSNPQNKKKNPFWSLNEQALHKNYDFLESEFRPSLYMGLPIHVLSIKFTKEICKIKVQFASHNAGANPFVLAIVNYMAKKENGKYKLYNALTFNKENWTHTNVGLVDFYCPPYHTFDREKAKKLNQFIHETCKNFGVNSRPFEYYLADDIDEIQELKGIDYYYGMGGKNMPSGRASDDKVYCGGLGEYYTHEVFHVQIDHHFPNRHFWASEGIATLLGGSRGKTLDWHVRRTNDYLNNHPEVDLNDMLQLSNLDNQTSYHYVLGGLIAKKILDKGGWNLLTELMSCGNADEDYYKAIERHLGVKKSELNKYLREQLQIESDK